MFYITFFFIRKKIKLNNYEECLYLTFNFALNANIILQIVNFYIIWLNKKAKKIKIKVNKRKRKKKKIKSNI